jgi:hypothetical protein
MIRRTGFAAAGTGIGVRVCISANLGILYALCDLCVRYFKSEPVTPASKPSQGSREAVRMDFPHNQVVLARREADDVGGPEAPSRCSRCAPWISSLLLCPRDLRVLRVNILSVEFIDAHVHGK